MCEYLEHMLYMVGIWERKLKNRESCELKKGIYFLNENVCMCKRLMSQIMELAQENRKNIMSIMMMLEIFVAR